ncbi:MAG: GNAT family N-acetyltransferase [Anaerolineaceae bacterium]|nr:GNAT family N-acetyltransferase [Anaerolineaceae bacterium]
MIIRPAHRDDAMAVARVQVDSWRTSYAGIVPHDHLTQLRYEDRAAKWGRNLDNPAWRSVLYVAEDIPGQIIGFACAGPEHDDTPGYTGEVYAIYLLQAAQRKGAGRALMRACAQWLLTHDYRTMLVWVLAANDSARRFYEALGGQYIHEKTVEIGGTPLLEVAYGWQDIRTLAG